MEGHEQDQLREGLNAVCIALSSLWATEAFRPNLSGWRTDRSIAVTEADVGASGLPESGRAIRGMPGVRVRAVDRPATSADRIDTLIHESLYPETYTMP